MAGHNKWSSIKHRKGAQDKARSKVFTKIIRELVVAAKMGGSDPEMNPRLRTAIQKAKSSNMPNDTLNKAIKRGAGELDGADYVEGTYEGYGPNGVGIIVEVLTDNKNRTAADVRHIFSKHGGALGSPGSVAYNFERIGQLVFSNKLGSEDDFMEHVLESGADDLISEGTESYEVVCQPENFQSVQDYFIGREIETLEAGVVYKAKVKVSLQGDDVLTMLKILTALEDNDDVQEVFSSFEATDQDMELAMDKL